MTDLKIKIGKIIFQNPIWVASGTFGSGKEFADFVDLRKVGAIIPKTVTLNERTGNPSPRIVETPSGLLNSIGLENKGIANFLKEEKTFLNKIKTKIIVSIAGTSLKEFTLCAAHLKGKNKPDAVEINLSCPNISHAGSKKRLFAQDPGETERIVKAVKKKTGLTVYAKLTPNVTDIATIAKAAEAGGADAVSLVNTYLGMAINAENKKPVLGNVFGGVSGPAIKPMALKAVWDV